MDVKVAYAQWKAIAPKVIVGSDGRKYRFNPKHTCQDEGTLCLKYWARKRQGELLGARINVVVSYDDGLDLYNVAMEQYEADCLSSESDGDRVEFKGLFWEDFANMGHPFKG